MVVKAQVKTGGRGKAGGVKVAKSPDEAEARAAEILGLDIKGHVVKAVAVAEGADIAEVLLFAVAGPGRAPISFAMCSEEERDGYRDACGGASRSPGPHPGGSVGIDQAKADEIVAAAGFSGPDAVEIARVLQLLGTVCQKEDATLVEVNPLIKTGDGKIIALDAKVSLDENAEFHQPDHAALADKSAENPLEAAAKAKGLNYVKLDGSVGIIGNGAGLVMSTLDVVAYAGEGFQVHRSRRTSLTLVAARRGDHGQRFGDHHWRRAGEERLRERVRRNYRLRRGSQRDRARIRAAGQS